MGRERVIICAMSKTDLLLVDDDRINLERLEVIARPFGFANILTATTITQAFAKMAVGQKVIFDLIMSRNGIEGSQLAKHYIQNLGGKPDKVAIHSSSFTDNEPYLPEEKWLRETILRITPNITLIPKFKTKSIRDFLVEKE